MHNCVYDKISSETAAAPALQADPECCRSPCIYPPPTLPGTFQRENLRGAGVMSGCRLLEVFGWDEECLRLAGRRTDDTGTWHLPVVVSLVALLVGAPMEVPGAIVVKLQIPQTPFITL